MSRHSYSSPEQQASDQVRYERGVARRSQRMDERAEAENAYRQERLNAISRGVPESSLPPVTSGMDVAAATRSLRYQTGGDEGNGPLDSATRFRRNPAAEQAAYRAVAQSPVSRDINRPNAISEATRAASPAPFMPGHGPLNLPNQRVGTSDAEQARGLARNLAMAQPGGMSPQTGQRAATQGAAPIGTRLANDGGAYRDALDAAMPQQQGPTADGAPVRTVSDLGANGHGTGSVRMAPGEPLGKQIPNDNGIVREGPYDLNAARIALKKSHPNVFIAGSPENKAFVDQVKFNMGKGMSPIEAQTHVHQNVDSLMATLTPKNGNPTPGLVKNDLGEEPSPERVAQLDKSIQESGLALPERIGRSIAGARKTAGGFVDNITSLPGRALGALDRAAQGFVRGATGINVPIQPASNLAPAIARGIGAVIPGGNNIANSMDGPMDRAVRMPRKREDEAL